MIKNQRVKLSQLHSLNELLNKPFWSSDGFATALGVASALAGTTVLAFVGTATALTFTAILTRAIVLARVAGRRVRAGRVGTVLGIRLHRDARHQSGDGCRDEKSSLSSGHILVWFWFIPASMRKTICAPE
jgi:hypothetical protein